MFLRSRVITDWFPVELVADDCWLSHYASLCDWVDWSVEKKGYEMVLNWDRRDRLWSRRWKG